MEPSKLRSPAARVRHIVCVCVCVCVYVRVCVCVCRDARDLSVWGPEGTGHLQQGYDI